MNGVHLRAEGHLQTLRIESTDENGPRGSSAEWSPACALHVIALGLRSLICKMGAAQHLRHGTRDGELAHRHGLLQHQARMRRSAGAT